MKKSILSLGTLIGKTEQKQINGGYLGTEGLQICKKCYPFINTQTCDMVAACNLERASLPN